MTKEKSVQAERSLCRLFLLLGQGPALYYGIASIILFLHLNIEEKVAYGKIKQDIANLK